MARRQAHTQASPGFWLSIRLALHAPFAGFQVTIVHWRFSHCKHLSTGALPGEEGGLWRPISCRGGGRWGGLKESAMEGLRRCWRLKEGEGDGGAARPGAFPPARGGRRRRPAVFGVSASRGITLSCAAPACAHGRNPSTLPVS